MSNQIPLTKDAVAQRADALLPQYQQIIANIPPEAGFGGIWESEMFLFYAAVKPFAPKQILESGRARGKSTLLVEVFRRHVEILLLALWIHSV